MAQVPVPPLKARVTDLTGTLNAQQQQADQQVDAVMEKLRELARPAPGRDHHRPRAVAEPGRGELALVVEVEGGEPDRPEHHQQEAQSERHRVNTKGGNQPPTGCERPQNRAGRRPGVEPPGDAADVFNVLDGESDSLR